MGPLHSIDEPVFATNFVIISLMIALELKLVCITRNIHMFVNLRHIKENIFTGDVQIYWTRDLKRKIVS